MNPPMCIKDHPPHMLTQVVEGTQNSGEKSIILSLDGYASEIRM
jgi:hypothetical protein